MVGHPMTDTTSPWLSPQPQTAFMRDLTFAQKQLACAAVTKLQDCFQMTPRAQREQLLDYIYQQILTQVFLTDGGCDAEQR
jgi:hypothetical protein